VSSRYFAPSISKPLTVVPRANLSFSTIIPNQSNTPDDCRTQAYTVTPYSVINRIVKKVIVVTAPYNYLIANRVYTCMPAGTTLYCAVDYDWRCIKDGVDIGPADGYGNDIIDNAPGVSHSYRVVETLTPNCPPCNTALCPGGCIDYRWTDISGELTGVLILVAGSNVPGHVVIEDVAPGQAIGFVSNFHPQDYEIMVNDELVEMHPWRDNAEDIVAWMPKGFRIRAGDELKIVVTSSPGDTRMWDFRIPRFDWLIV
jgi:hypothetical protein